MAHHRAVVSRGVFAALDGLLRGRITERSGPIPPAPGSSSLRRRCRHRVRFGPNIKSDSCTGVQQPGRDGQGAQPDGDAVPLGAMKRPTSDCAPVSSPLKEDNVQEPNPEALVAATAEEVVAAIAEDAVRVVLLRKRFLRPLFDNGMARRRWHSLGADRQRRHRVLAMDVRSSRSSAP